LSKHGIAWLWFSIRFPGSQYCQSNGMSPD
jgi:hypothetical protein